jgi:hypothetical protein
MPDPTLGSDDDAPGWSPQASACVGRNELTGLKRAPGLVAPLYLSQEDVMFELNFSSNADWLVAVLLVVTVVAAALV